MKAPSTQFTRLTRRTQPTPTNPPPPGALSVRVPTPEEVPAFDQQLAAKHYLGAGRPVGHYLRQIVERDGQPVALLVWGPACYALKDRDRWISWSLPQRLERLKLLVQNRRFLLLTPKGAAPNLASQVLAAAVRALPEQWRQHFGYRPLLAESFTDPEAHAGTCYKASNWEPVGLSAGYSRHRADFYIPNQRPKKLWLYPLCPDAKALLRAPQLPALDGQLLTADPLHCQRGHARTIVEKGGDYLFQIKGNQPGLRQQAQRLDTLQATPFLNRAKAATAG